MCRSLPSFTAALLVFALAACSDRISPNADAQVSGQDQCEPTSFNAALGDGTCTKQGNVTLTAFNNELSASHQVAAWRFERLRSERRRGGVHLLAGGVLGSIAVALLTWSVPLAVVAGLATWGVVLAAFADDEVSVLPLIGVAVATGAAALSALDQLASRQAYAYLPFLTRSSASALLATAGLAGAGWVLARGRGAPTEWADRAVRLAAVIGFAIVWGRMEFAEAFSRDWATFLLIAYYAACGVASIVIGRRLGIQRLRVAGLVLAIYAALKSVMHASDISGVLLRVAAYGAVGVFLLGAGYGYRERKDN